jgi:hypothetical protein
MTTPVAQIKLPAPRLVLKGGLMRLPYQNYVEAGALFHHVPKLKIAPSPYFAKKLREAHPELTDDEFDKLQLEATVLYMTKLFTFANQSSFRTDLLRARRNWDRSNAKNIRDSFSYMGGYEKGQFEWAYMQQAALDDVFTVYGLVNDCSFRYPSDKNSLIGTTRISGKAFVPGWFYQISKQLEKIDSAQSRKLFLRRLCIQGLPATLIYQSLDVWEVLTHKALLSGTDHLIFLTPLINMVKWGDFESTFTATDETLRYRLRTLEEGPYQVNAGAKTPSRDWVPGAGYMGVHGSDKKKYTTTWHAQDQTFWDAISGRIVDAETDTTFTFTTYNGEDPGAFTSGCRSKGVGIHAKYGDKEERKTTYYAFLRELCKKSENGSDSKGSPLSPYKILTKELAEKLASGGADSDSLARDFVYEDAVILWRGMAAGINYFYRLVRVSTLFSWDPDFKPEAITDLKRNHAVDGMVGNGSSCFHMGDGNRVKVTNCIGHQSAGRWRWGHELPTANDQGTFEYRSCAGKLSGGGIVTACYRGYYLFAGAPDTNDMKKLLSGLRIHGKNGGQYIAPLDSSVDTEIDDIGLLGQIMLSSFSGVSDGVSDRYASAAFVVLLKEGHDDPTQYAEDGGDYPTFTRIHVQFGGVFGKTPEKPQVCSFKEEVAL